MDVDRDTRVLKSPLVLWIRTFSATSLADLTDLLDGYLLNKIMTEIDPTFFGMTFVHSNVFGDINLRIHNMECLMRSLRNYYKEKLQQVIIMDTPDVFVMANNPESDECIEELNKILLLILGCAVQCERKEFFIEKITTMDESIQEELVVYIREITEKFDKVFSFQPNEVAALSHEELLSYCEHMYDQIILLVNQRDSTSEEMHQLRAERSITSEEVNGNVSRVSSPPLSPTNSDFILAEKAKLRKATEEVEEKNLLIQELRDELESNKVTLERLLQENKSLSDTTRFVNAYRDQLDVLKIKAEKVTKLENEILKFKEKLIEMDVLKKRKEELEEQNEILYNTKIVLEKQVNTLNPKADKLVATEREVARLKSDLKDVIEEKKGLQARNKHLLDENAVLLLDAQNSLSEVSNLNSELNMIKDKDGEGTCLANEYNQVSSTQLLKLENENHRLKVLVAELRQEKAVPQSIVQEEALESETYEQVTEHVDRVSEEAEVKLVKRQSSLRKTLPVKENALIVVKEKLKQKEEFANKISESLLVMEQENSELQDRIQQMTNQKRRNEQLIQRKNEDVTELERRLEEVTIERQKCEATLRLKSREINELTNSLDEVSSDLQLRETKVKDLEERKSYKNMNMLLNHTARVRTLESEKQENEGIRYSLKEREESAVFLNEKIKKCMEELAVHENRLEEADSQNRKLQHSIKMKEEKIVNLEASVLELEEVTNHNEKMKQMVQQKEDKIRTMEKKVDECEEANRHCERLNQKLTDQEQKAVVLNDRISELEVHESNNKRLKLTVAQKDDRIKYLEQSLEETELKFTKLENEIAKTHNNYEEKVKRSLEDVDTHKIRRIESVRRREEQIKSLEKSRTKLETVLHAQEGHIQSLQDRLEGSVSERDKLGLTIRKKETIINQLQSKILELEESTGETEKMNELIKKKDETIKRYEDRVREVELVLARTKTSTREKEEMIDTLQQRIDECEERHKKLDSKLKKKEEALQKAEQDLGEVENREKELENSLERKSKNLEERNSRILELEASLDQRNSLVSKRSEESLLQSPRNSTLLDSNKVQTLKQKLWDAEARIEETENEQGKLQHQIKRKETQIQNLEQRLQESSDALEENERLKQTIKHKEERVRILQTSLDQNQKEINSLESRLESTTSEVYKLRKVDGEKQKRINSFKIKLEGSAQGVHEIITNKDEKIKSLEEKNGELKQEKIHLNNRLTLLGAELEKLRGKKGSAETIIVNSSPRCRPDVACVTIDNARNLETRYEDLEKECEKLRLNKERTEGRYVALKEENNSLTQEVNTVRSDYEQLLNGLNELKESYTELDLSSAKSLHRCEMLTQMNSTLEEENRMLMEQMNKLLTQNQELLTESLVSRDQFLVEERTFSDRLYELQRQKEKLEEKIEEANKSLAENAPKKKSNLFKKVLQKAGLKKKKDEALKSKSTVKLIKYDESPSGEGMSDMSVDSGPGTPMSPERASDSSNFSESLNSDNSPENDLSPLARRRARVNRANRQRIVRSEYFTPAMANSLAIQGRSRSLDAKEFIREAVQAQGSEPSPGQVSTCNSMTVLNESSPGNCEDSGREEKHSREVNRTLSFSTARSGNLSPAHVRRRSAESRLKNPPEYKPAQVNGEKSPIVRQKSGSAKVETEKVTPKQSPLIKDKMDDFKVEVSAGVNGESSPYTRKKSPETKVEENLRADINEDSSPLIKRKDVNPKVEVTSENSPTWKKSVSHTVEVTPELAIWENRKSRSSHHDDSSSSSRRVSESSRKSSDVSSLHSRTSSITENDTLKTTVRHVGSTPSGNGCEKIEKKADINVVNTDELQTLSSGSSDSVGNERQKRSSWHYTSAPHTTRSSETPTKDTPSFSKEKTQARRSNSFAERPHSPSLARSQVQRQNSDRVLVSSMEIERRKLLHAKATPSSPTSERPRRPLSVGQRPDSMQRSGQSIGIVSFTEVPTVQSAVLESSPRPERKEQAVDLDERKSGEIESGPKLKETAHRGPQTPKSLKRTTKVENLAPKNEKSSDTSALWYEYGQV